MKFVSERPKLFTVLFQMPPSARPLLLSPQTIERQACELISVLSGYMIRLPRKAQTYSNEHTHLKQHSERRDPAPGLDGFIQRVVAMRLITVDLHL